jgi:hypothetical protein
MKHGNDRQIATKKRDEKQTLTLPVLLTHLGFGVIRTLASPEERVNRQEFSIHAIDPTKKVGGCNPFEPRGKLRHPITALNDQ